MKNQKGFIPILLLLFVVLFLSAAVGFYSYKNGQIKIRFADTPLNSPTSKVDPTANWKTYINTKYGFQIKYPATYHEAKTSTLPDDSVDRTPSATMVLTKDSKEINSDLEIYIVNKDQYNLYFLNDSIGYKNLVKQKNDTYIVINTSNLNNQGVEIDQILSTFQFTN